MSNKCLPLSETTNPRCVEKLSPSASATSSYAQRPQSSFFGSSSTELRLLMVGLDGGGKTVIFNKTTGSATGPAATATSNTIGFNVTTTPISFFSTGDTLSMWDMGGLSVLRKKWREYFAGVDGIVFVVDASNKARFSEAREELASLLAVSELSNAPILIFANKQDVDGAATVEEVEKEIVAAVPSSVSRQYRVQGCAAASAGADGVRVGLEWMHAILKAKGAGVKKGMSTGALAMAAGVVVACAAALVVKMQ